MGADLFLFFNIFLSQKQSDFILCIGYLSAPV